jgi:peptidoglycan L-alanyl-D-glutamate endopeptidase CwlK
MDEDPVDAMARVLQGALSGGKIRAEKARKKMPKFSQSSKEKLETCDVRLQIVLNKAIELVDFTVIEGRRSKERQDRLFIEGKTKVKWPDSYHNTLDPEGLAKAVDIAPWYPEKGIDWRTDHALWNAVQAGNFEEAREVLENIKRWKALIGVILGIAYGKGIALVNGSDWDRDFRFDDHRFVDSPHFQIRRT